MMLNHLIVVLLALVCVPAVLIRAGDPSPPIFGPVMTAPFNQTIRLFGFVFDKYDHLFQHHGSVQSLLVVCVDIAPLYLI